MALNVKKIKKGEPLYGKILKYCTRCCMPDTAHGIYFNEKGVCSGCISHDQKRKIDWLAREKKLKKLLKHYKSISKGKYDCVVGVSGGKDSTWQMHILVKVYKMKPLVITASQGSEWTTEVGKYNLRNLLEKFKVDHVIFTPSQDLVNRCSRQSLFKLGDTCWHCHAGVGAFVVKMAVAYKIPLIVWGESGAEYGTYGATLLKPLVFDAEYFHRVSIKIPIKDMVSDNLPLKDLCPFHQPLFTEMKKAGIKGIFLGDYINWDTEKQVKLIKKEYNWKEANVEGTYKRYKSIDCIMEGMHSFTRYLKRGYGRATDHVSDDIRHGRLSRMEGFELIKKYDPSRPKNMDNWLKITNLTEDEMFDALVALRKGTAKKLPHPQDMIK